MDNASKALIMVGAILIAVMLVSLGVFVYTYSKEKVDSSLKLADSMEVSAYNSQFTSFIGSDIRGSQVKQLINLCNSTQGTDNPVDCDITDPSMITNGATYTVEGIPNAAGYYSSFTIEEN